ncbi:MULTISPECIES: acetyl-CoA hydrolase/transferase family protein [Bacteroidales]|uniref:4-hydroxybutyrate CoA-transferase n=2 Tax=Porphyromonas loveana TaxID=1884669 RepID=A0A2U1F9A1_9PORP|nr:acetyl-CoA hydrolase/transferase C-terminal domain-containing protein [Porphyromonas loveana]PVZ08762.1 4-hydroxybutyrate CoA-transferase [Porphyromonas loveana]
MEWQELYQQRVCSADEAVLKTLKLGTKVVFGHAAGAPARFSQAMHRQREKLEDITVFHMLYFGDAPHLLPEMRPHVHPTLNFLEGNSRPAYCDRRVDFIPCHFHEVPELFRQGFFPLDVAVVQVSAPNAEGYCSFGVACDYTKAAAECAPVVVAEVNKQMPFIGGENLIHVSKLHHIIEVDEPIAEVLPPAISDVELKIGQNCASLIKDGDTLQLGIGGIPDAVLRALEGHKDLGIHTEMFTDGVMRMIRKGVINGSKKTLHPGKVVTSLIFGSKELYDFVNNNPMIECYPVDYTNSADIIGKNDNMVSINSCLEMDLMGQAASESIGYEQFSGSGGQVDFFRGAKRSKGGISIMAIPSTAKKGTESRIVPLLKEGTCVTTGRNEVDYVVTEYGVARLRGATLRKRAEALTAIAHPDFRPALEAEVRRRFDKQ